MRSEKQRTGYKEKTSKTLQRSVSSVINHLKYEAGSPSSLLVAGGEAEWHLLSTSPISFFAAHLESKDVQPSLNA